MTDVTMNHAASLTEKMRETDDKREQKDVRTILR